MYCLFVLSLRFIFDTLRCLRVRTPEEPALKYYVYYYIPSGS